MLFIKESYWELLYAYKFLCDVIFVVFMVYLSSVKILSSKFH